MVSWEDNRTKLVLAAKAAAAENGGFLLRDQFVKIAGITASQIYRAFPDGGFTELLRLSGIPDHPEHQKRRPVSTEDIVREMHRVFVELQRIPSRTLYDAHSRISSGTTEKRFGSWSKALVEYSDWLVTNDPSVPWATELQTKVSVEKPLKVEHLHSMGKKVVDDANKLADRIVYGELLNFRGLQHAPINEQGVVYLFGMVSHELGFMIEAVQTGFPDCHGKRRVKGNRWQTVRIEFEYQSRNFLVHGHDAVQCDLIVCWEHNWPECPLEVVCLKERIKVLRSSLE